MLGKVTPFVALVINTIVYSTCATFPKKGMAHFLEVIHNKLLDNGVDIFLESEIIKINTHDKKVVSVIDDKNITYIADKYVSNVDPQATMQLCNYPISGKFNYTYTHSCYTLFLGLKDIDIKKYGFGNFNIWYFASNEVIDKGYSKALDDLDYSNSWFFISTPSTHVAPDILAPSGCHTMQIVAPANYTKIAELKRVNEQAYIAVNERVKQSMISVITDHFKLPLGEHIAFEEFWSPLDLANKVKTPCGAIYGMEPTAQKLKKPVGHLTPFTNLYLVGATSTLAGLGNVLSGSMNVFKILMKE